MFIGLFAFPQEQAAELAFETVINFFLQHEKSSASLDEEPTVAAETATASTTKLPALSLRTIIFDVFTDADWLIYSKLFEKACSKQLE